MSFDLYARQLLAGQHCPYNAVVYAKPDSRQFRTNERGELVLAKIRDTEIEYILPTQLFAPKLGICVVQDEVFPNPLMLLMMKLAERDQQLTGDVWLALPWMSKHCEVEDLENVLRKVLQDCYDASVEYDIYLDDSDWLSNAIAVQKPSNWTGNETIPMQDVAIDSNPLLKQASDKIATKYWEAPKVSWSEWSRKIEYIMDSIRNPEIGELYEKE